MPFTQLVTSTLNVETGIEVRILLSAGVALLLAILRLVSLRFIDGRVSDDQHIYRWHKAISYVTILLAVLIIGPVWLVGIGSVATVFGLISAGLAIALRDPVTDLFGWLFILWRRPFEVGDRIEVGSYRGDVVDIRIFQFSILEIGNWVPADQSTGRIINIPNQLIFGQPLANYTTQFNYVWHEVPVLLTYESDWRRGKVVLQEIANRHGTVDEEAKKEFHHAATHYLIQHSSLDPVLYTRAADSGIEITLRYLVEPRRRRVVENAIWEDVLDAFDKESKLDLAYPTQRIIGLETAE